MAVPRGFRFTRRHWAAMTALFGGLFVHFVLYGWLVSGFVGGIGLLWVFVAKLGHVPMDDDLT
jgi:hypothetical protein